MGPSISSTDSKYLPKFKVKVPVDFSYWMSYEFYNRKETDDESYTFLEDVFRELPLE